MRYRLGRIVIIGFAASVNLIVLFVLWSIATKSFDPEYVNFLSTVGAIWGPLAGAIVGFYYARASQRDDLDD